MKRKLAEQKLLQTHKTRAQDKADAKAKRARDFERRSCFEEKQQEEKEKICISNKS
jgi:hypothetical protein